MKKVLFTQYLFVLNSKSHACGLSISHAKRISHCIVIYRKFRQGFISLRCALKGTTLKHLGYIVYKPFGLFPAKTGVGYRFAVDLGVRDALRSVLNIAFNHKSFDY